MHLFFRSGSAAPSTRAAGAPRSRARALRRSRVAVAMTLAGAVMTAGVVLGTPLEASAASKYPTWHDVQVAANNQTVKAREVTAIQKLLVSLEADVKSKNEIAAKKGTELQEAQLAYDKQENEKAKLQAKADQADRVAKASETRAGQLAAQLGRSGSNNISSDLIANPGSASNLLYKLGAMSKLTEQANGIYAQAVQDRNAAQGLTDQAAVAAKALNALKVKAASALEDATSAAAAAQAAQQEQAGNATRLQAQLTAIKAKRVLTQAKYNKGEKIRKERAAAALRRQQEAAAKASGATGVANNQGWTRPAGGYITSGFGMRVDPVTGVYTLHAGTDLGAACGSNIYAAHSGTVVYAGPYGGYGNFVLIDNGSGISTGYGHIVDGGIHVAVGQTVTVGQIVAQVGSTGWSTGCHLHFETRVGGVAQDAVPFMSARGVTL
ncbi:murein DD-endopeptidase MepM/ murein hydrolase activator NlpD [Frondihabitans sp. PhB188]|uniref:M23 family metallopeptidase n=1 Tax=Frondihabitans sp. PhB188 TaxID=2485200 RepID=UPI000F492DD7|nr:M23 family metallopeptidase [Frondihabitans sp. PhB188]ROQ37195.1 murein DD-endopeptidase MepM/ murein hydrolase activator NlpD [Frondihabitans sp. PhB188]